MQEKHTKAKETDITSALVITFVILVAALIAKVAGDFTSTTTSTQTKAAPQAVTKEQTAWCKANAPLNGDFNRKVAPNYDASLDFCAGPMTICGDLKDTLVARDATDTYLTMSNKDKNKCGYGLDKGIWACCRNAGKTNVLGDNLCRNEFSNDAFCIIGGNDAKTTCSNSYGSSAQSNVKCAKTGYDKLGTNILSEGYCCNVPLSVSQTNCGRKHVNCDKFNALSATDNDNLKNTNVSGVKVTTTCMQNISKTDAFCVNENATIDIGGYIRCDGSQFANNVFGQYGCYTTAYNSVPAVVGNKFYCLYSEVQLNGGACKDKIHR